ncbi:MAG: ferrous iron transporter B [Planctomycetota bacterium]
MGSPNSGKSTLYNKLTGQRSKVANYPGVTVERVETDIRINARALRLVDLPGAYTLEAMSPDEDVARKVVEGSMEGSGSLDGIVVLADATSLRRSMSLVAEIMSRGLPTMLVLTMIDELKARRGSIRTLRLSEELGIPVVAVVGNKGLGIEDVRYELGRIETWNRAKPPEEIRTDIESRYAWVERVLSDCFEEPKQPTTLTDRLDGILLHPLWGIATFFLVMFLFFQTIFAWAEPLQNLMEAVIGGIGELLRSALPPGLIESLLVDGIIAGVGGVLTFLPQIAIILILIHFLEGTGYMARAAFVIDRVMGWVGLEGRCFVALLSSYACAIPGIMAARTVPDHRSRIATIMVAPFMTCSARLPIYTLLIGAFVPGTHVLGFFNLQGLTFFGLYLLGSVSALVAAAVFKRGVLRGQGLPFTMELPPYRRPMPGLVWTETLRGIKGFLRKAGTVILAASIVLWFLLTFPGTDTSEQVAADQPAIQALELEHSYAAAIGKTIEPVIEPLGFDWRIGVGLVASMAAREVMVSSLAQIFAVQHGEEDFRKLGDQLRNTRDPRSGKSVYTLATAFSLLVFFVYALQCISTLAVMRRETNGWKWPILAFSYMLVIAYVASFLTYQATSAWIA